MDNQDKPNCGRWLLLFCFFSFFLTVTADDMANNRMIAFFRKHSSSHTLAMRLTFVLKSNLLWPSLFHLLLNLNFPPISVSLSPSRNKITDAIIIITIATATSHNLHRHLLIILLPATLSPGSVLLLAISWLIGLITLVVLMLGLMGSLRWFI